MIGLESGPLLPAPYVGHRGWLGIYLDSDIDEDEVAGALEDAFVTIPPKSLVKTLGN